MSSGTEYRFGLSSKAQRDLRVILRYTGERWGDKQLLIYRDRLYEAFNTLKGRPSLGHTSSRLPKTRLLYPVGSHVVYYRVLGNAVRVDRILHKRMNPAKHL